MCSCKGGRYCLVCKIFGGIATALLVVTSFAAVIGVWVTHSTEAGWVFGTTQGSLALGTVILSVVALWKTVHALCGCGSASGCGCGSGCECGGNCNCGGGKPGMCPGCGKNPCKCK